MKSKDAETVARKPGRPALDRREEILDAAERLYDHLGFEKTTVGDVAKAIGMSPANLYRSFPSRQAIDEAIAARKLRVLEDAAWTAARTASIDAPEALRRLVLDVMRPERGASVQRGTGASPVRRRGGRAVAGGGAVRPRPARRAAARGDRRPERRRVRPRRPRRVGGGRPSPRSARCGIPRCWRSTARTTSRRRRGPSAISC